jgi:hypothetical protein
VGIVNKIITRGFGFARDGIGNRAGPVTRGYGGKFIEQIVELVRHRVLGGKAKRRYEDIDEIIVHAKLIDVNDAPPSHKIEGWVRVKVSGEYVRSLVKLVTSRVKSYLVKATRIKR